MCEGDMPQSSVRINPNPNRLDHSVVQVGDAVGAFIEYWGFKAVHGRVWTLLALHVEPMSQTQLGAHLGVSRSLISGSVAELSRQGLVAAVGDHRNAPYVAVLDVWPVIKDVVRRREWMLIESARLALESAIQEAEAAQAHGHPVAWDVTRMRLLLSMTELSQAVLKILFVIGIPRSVEGFGDWVRKASSLMGTFRVATSGSR
jgi:DNA-binding transcriptional regulator GbsR (MarR family)